MSLNCVLYVDVYSQTFQQLLGATGAHIQLTYQFHEDALRTTTSYSNPVRYKLAAGADK
jgi:hypothetical protein